jgi:hypothetical protein
LEAIGSLFENILLDRNPGEIRELGLIYDEQFGFRPKHDTSLQLANVIARVTMNFGEKSLTGVISFDVAKAVDTVWIDELLYELVILSFPYYLVKDIQSYPRGRKFEASFQTATSSRRVIRAVVAYGGLITPVLFSLC